MTSDEQIADAIKVYGWTDTRFPGLLMPRFAKIEDFPHGPIRPWIEEEGKPMEWNPEFENAPFELVPFLVPRTVEEKT
jgi:hypothetical protein